MKKLFLLFLLLPFLGWSQNTSFTAEQIELSTQFYKTIENTKLTPEEIVREVEGFLAKVPYHPYSVYALLITKRELLDFNFIIDYCSRLDDNYLSTFQPILIEACACVYLYKKDSNVLYHRIIPLIEDVATKELFLTAYYYEIDNFEEFKKLAKSSLSKIYEKEWQKSIKSYLLSNLILKSDDLSAIIKDFETIIFSSELNAIAYYRLVKSSVYNNDFVMAKKLIDYFKKLNDDNSKYHYPISAFFFSYKGEEQLAIEALESAFNMEDKDFEEIIESDKNDIFIYYIEPISKIKDIKNRERLVKQAIKYFEKRDNYRVRFKLYQSLLLASKDINKAKAILKECAPYLEELNLKDLDYMIRIENELGKDYPNYRLVDDMTLKVTPYINYSNMLFVRTVFRYKVNYNSKEPVFNVNEMVEELDKLIKRTLNREEKQKYLYFKIVTILINDKEWAERELEKLSEEEANEIKSKIESVSNNPGKFSEVINSNKEEIKDIIGTFIILNSLNVNYINALKLKDSNI